MRSHLLAHCAVFCLVIVALSACGGSGSTTAAPPVATASSGSPAATTAATTAPTAASATTLAPTPTVGTVAPTIAPTVAAGATPPATAVAAGAAVSFKTDLQPFFAASCTGCHGAAAGLSLTSYADVMKGGQAGAAVKAGDAQGSLLVQKVKGTQTTGARMPPGGTPLADAQIQKISDWVAQGAQDN